MIASNFSRLFARIFDYFVIFLLFLPTILLSDMKNGKTVTPSLFPALLTNIALLYFLLADSLPNGQSLGKKIFGIAVVSTRTDKNCSILQSFIRNVFFAVPFGGLLELIAIASDEQGRRIGDKLARTIVIKRGTR
jgi:uncharacterized RDD family membrane protein YckC